MVIKWATHKEGFLAMQPNCSRTKHKTNFLLRGLIVPNAIGLLIIIISFKPIERMNAFYSNRNYNCTNQNHIKEYLIECRMGHI